MPYGHAGSPSGLQAQEKYDKGVSSLQAGPNCLPSGASGRVPAGGELGAGPSTLGVSSLSRSWEQDLAPPVQMTWISFPPLNSPARLALF